MSKANAEWQLDRLEKAGVIDGKVVGGAMDPEGFFGLVIQPKGTRAKGRQKILWFLRDDEGNGPGGMDITDGQGG